MIYSPNCIKIQGVGYQFTYLYGVFRRTNVFVLLSSEYIEANKVNLRVAVFAGLGRGHLHYLAGESPQHNVATLAQRGALDMTSEGGLSIAIIEILKTRH